MARSNCRPASGLLHLMAALLLWSSGLVHAQKIEFVNVTATGHGATAAQAVLDALTQAIAQVNGESIASDVRLRVHSVTQDGQRRSEKRFDKEISRETDGVVRSWREIRSTMGAAGVHEAVVEAAVVVLTRSPQLERMKVAVVPRFADPPSTTTTLVGELTSLLTSSRKFAVMDRRNQSAVQAQLERIRSGGTREDQVRRAAEVAPDVIAVVDTKVFRSGLGRQTLEARLEIVDYATRQIKFSEVKRLPVDLEDPRATSARIRILARGLSRALLDTVYPPLIVGADGLYVTIAQGSDYFSVGDRLVVRRLGAAIRDPHTGEFLGFEHVDLGEAEIVYTDKRVSKGQLVSPIDIDVEGIAAKAYRVSRLGQVEGGYFGDIAVRDAAAPGHRSRGLFVTGQGADADADN